MMAQKKSPEGIQYSGFFDALVKIPRQEGIMAMYKVRCIHNCTRLNFVSCAAWDAALSTSELRLYLTLPLRRRDCCRG